MANLTCMRHTAVYETAARDSDGGKCVTPVNGGGEDGGRSLASIAVWEGRQQSRDTGTRGCVAIHT